MLLSAFGMCSHAVGRRLYDHERLVGLVPARCTAGYDALSMIDARRARPYNTCSLEAGRGREPLTGNGPQTPACCKSACTPMETVFVTTNRSFALTAAQMSVSVRVTSVYPLWGQHHVRRLQLACLQVRDENRGNPPLRHSCRLSIN
jgi:hypothetical protein